MSEGKVIYYICPKCFDMTKTPPDREGHQGKLIVVDPGIEGDTRRKPPVDKHGHILTRAPRWYLEAIGILEEDK